MASEMTVIQHVCEGFLRFIISKDTVTVDMEVMTLKGIHIFRQDKNSNEKTSITWSEDNTPPSSFLKRLKETQSKQSAEFLESFLARNLEPNFRPQQSCTWPQVAKVSDNQFIQDIKLKRARQMDNASAAVNNMETQNRPPKPNRKMLYHSEWSDSKNEKDNQARAPIPKTPPQSPQASTSFASYFK